MRHRYVPKPKWKVWYAISYWDFNWNEIEPLGKSGLDAFGVTGRVYEFTQLWARLESGLPVELPDDRVPIAFTIEVYHVETETEGQTKSKRLCAGHPEGRDCRTPDRPRGGDGSAVPPLLHDAGLGQSDADKASGKADDSSRGSALEGSARHADGDYHRPDCVLVAHNGSCRLESGDPREKDSVVSRVATDKKEVADD